MGGCQRAAMLSQARCCQETPPAIMAVEGTDGRELDLERRVHLLAQGILLERVSDGRTSLQIHALGSEAIRDPRS
jgi:hypothetical protein